MCRAIWPIRRCITPRCFRARAEQGLPYANYALSSSNPYLSAADQATIQANLAAAGQDPSTFYLARANTDLYQGGFRTRSDLARFVGGIDGDFKVGTHTFTWEGTVNYGQSNTMSSQPGLVWQNIENATNAVQGANGIQCAAGYTNAPIATQNSTCSPLNLFGIGHVSQSALAYITANAQSNQVNKQLDAVVDIKGDIAHLPGGDLKFVLGAEIRGKANRLIRASSLKANTASMPRSNRLPDRITRMKASAN